MKSTKQILLLLLSSVDSSTTGLFGSLTYWKTFVISIKNIMLEFGIAFITSWSYKMWWFQYETVVKSKVNNIKSIQGEKKSISDTKNTQARNLY